MIVAAVLAVYVAIGASLALFDGDRPWRRRHDSEPVIEVVLLWPWVVVNGLREKWGRWVVVESWSPRWAGSERVEGDEREVGRFFTRRVARRVCAELDSCFDDPGFRVVLRSQWEEYR